MDVLDDLVGHVEDDVVVETVDRSGLAGGGRKSADRRIDRQGRQSSASSRARWSRCRRTARCARWSAAAIMPTASSTAPSRRSASPVRRSSHSSISTALERGLTPDTVREDKPVAVKGWKPENYSREYFGPVTLTQALSMSLNTVSVRLTLEFGPTAVMRTAHRLGIASKLEPNASIGARHFGSLGAGTDVGLRAIRQWRQRDRAARGRARPHRRRQADLSAQAAKFARPGRSSRAMSR